MVDNEAALSLCASKVAAQNGDIRAAFSAADIAFNEITFVLFSLVLLFS